MSRPAASLKVRALQWLAQREQSPQELRQKLLRLALAEPAPRRPPYRSAGWAAKRDPMEREPDEASPADEATAVDPAQAAAEVDALMAWLESHGYLSAQRFIESRVHARQARFGQQRIQHELARHGLELPTESQQALANTELERAREIWLRKFGQPAGDTAGRLRQMRFLAGRGFSHDVVRRVVRVRQDEASERDDPSAQD